MTMAAHQFSLFDPPAPKPEPEVARPSWWQWDGPPVWEHRWFGLLSPRDPETEIQWEGPQCHWPRPCDLEAKWHLRRAHVAEALRSDRTPAELLVQAHAAAACDFIPDSCRLYQEAARRQAALDGREHNEMPERA